MTPERLANLVDRHAAALVLYARQWCAQPEDVVQDAFIRLHQQRCVPDDPLAWLYCVARNRAISHGRSDRRRRSRESTVASLAPTWFASDDESTGLDAATAVEALTELSLDQREIVIAHLWGGLTFVQIAELVSTSSATAFRRYQAALVLLRQRLGVSCPNPN